MNDNKSNFNKSENEDVTFPNSLPGGMAKITRNATEKRLIKVFLILIWTSLILGMTQFISNKSIEETKTKFAVVDLSVFRAEVAEKYGNEQVSSYTRKLMAIYRANGYVVLDIKSVVTMPIDMELVKPKYSVAEIDDALQKLGIEPDKYGNSQNSQAN